jgi:phosphoglycerol transferase MdoB-like AlkP superfamily enzyme
MIRILKYLLSLFLFWILYFVVSKFLFIVFEWNIVSKVGLQSLASAIVVGLKMDIATACYVLIIACVFSLFLLINEVVFRKIMGILISVLITLFSFIIVADFELYKNWLSHIDVSVFQFFDMSFSALSSTSNLRITGLVLSWIILSSTFITLYYRFVAKQLQGKTQKYRWFHPFILLIAGAVLFIPARGGIDVASMNTGSVYFSQNMTANHVAVNPVWNFLYSFNRISSLKNPYVYMDSKKANGIYELIKEGKDSSLSVLNTKNPNIIFVMMESFESDITKTLGGRDGITPNFDSLTHEGILFSNMIASGSRTDKGFVSILCGYAAQSVNPIIKFTRKIEKLPTISKILANNGYNTIFMYGGNKQFTNMNSLIMAGGFADVTDKNDFDKSLQTFKWGVHDEFIFHRSIEKMNASKTPFFTYIMSLSSHEPFEVPTKKVFKGDGDEPKYFNSAYYTDSCLGVFIANAKKQAWWKNTLIVLVADHATIMPGNKTNENVNRFRIPMLWLGGALNVRDTIVAKYCSQMDIAKTVLKQLNKDSSPFIYSKNIFNQNNNGYALFCYNDGFGLISDSYCQIFDNITMKYSTNKGSFSGNDSLVGKAFWQVVNEDFVKK